MDVLVGSIDVRELLSTEDLEESSPLSAPDLRLLTDRLQIRSLQIKSKVRDYILSHYSDFTDIFSRCAVAASGAERTSAALADAIRVLSDCPVDGEICDLAREIMSKKRELEDRREALAVVGTISTFLERLKVAREDVRARRLVEAAVAVRDLKKGLRVSDADDSRREEEEPVVFEFLRKDWLECFDKLQCTLLLNVENFILFEPEKNGVSVVYSLKSGKADEKIDLYRVLEAMETVDVLDYGLAKVADLLIKHVIGPAITNKCSHVSEDYNQDSAAILIIINSSPEFHGDRKSVV